MNKTLAIIDAINTTETSFDPQDANKTYSLEYKGEQLELKYIPALGCFSYTLNDSNTPNVSNFKHDYKLQLQGSHAAKYNHVLGALHDDDENGLKYVLQGATSFSSYFSEFDAKLAIPINHETSSPDFYIELINLEAGDTLQLERNGDHAFTYTHSDQSKRTISRESLLNLMRQSGIYTDPSITIDSTSIFVIHDQDIIAFYDPNYYGDAINAYNEVFARAVKNKLSSNTPSSRFKKVTISPIDGTKKHSVKSKNFYTRKEVEIILTEDQLQYFGASEGSHVLFNHGAGKQFALFDEEAEIPPEIAPTSSTPESSNASSDGMFYIAGDYFIHQVNTSGFNQFKAYLKESTRYNKEKPGKYLTKNGEVHNVTSFYETGLIRSIDEYMDGNQQTTFYASKSLSSDGALDLEFSKNSTDRFLTKKDASSIQFKNQNVEPYAQAMPPIYRLFTFMNMINDRLAPGKSARITIKLNHKGIFYKSYKLIPYPSLLPHTILPSAVVLSTIFMGASVISIPAFTMALMVASGLGALALQVAIYQTQSTKENQSFIQNPWISHNAMAFGLAAIAYFTLMANPLAALIVVASIMTVTPLATLIMRESLFCNNPTSLPRLEENWLDWQFGN